MLTSKTSYLLQLPLELREQIYAYVLPYSPTPDSPNSPPIQDAYNHWRRGSLALLYTNSQIFSEASRIFWGTNAFGFTVHDSGIDVYIEYAAPPGDDRPRVGGARKHTELRHIRPEHVQSVTQASLYVPTHYTTIIIDEVEEAYRAWSAFASQQQVRVNGTSSISMDQWFTETYFPSMSEARGEYRRGVFRQVEELVSLLGPGERVRRVEMDFESYSTPTDEAVYEATGPDAKLVKGVLVRFPDGLRGVMVVRGWSGT